MKRREAKVDQLAKGEVENDKPTNPEGRSTAGTDYSVRAATVGIGKALFSEEFFEGGTKTVSTSRGTGLILSSTYEHERVTRLASDGNLSNSINKKPDTGL